jgi:hypothetical protein
MVCSRFDDGLYFWLDMIDGTGNWREDRRDTIKSLNPKSPLLSFSPALQKMENGW